MDRPPLGSVGRASSQVDAWTFLIEKICDQLETDELRKVLQIMFGIEYDEEEEAEDMEDEGMGMDLDVSEYVRETFRKKMTSDTDHQLRAERLQQTLDDLGYFENNVKMSDMVQEFLNTYDPVREINPHEIFVGRDGDVEDIVNIFERKVPKYKKIKCVSVCGIGGQGKTTLARYVCEKLNWVTYKADLRGKLSTSDLIKALLAANKQMLPQSDEQLLEEFKTFLLQLTSRTLFYMDDCDVIMSKDREKFYKFLDEILVFIQDKHEVCFLLTTRVKMDEKSLKLSRNLVKQLELDSLKKPDAIELLCKASGRDIAHMLAEEIVTECACSPLAVTTVATMIKQDQFTAERLLFHLKMDKKNVTKAIKIDHCIETAVNHLHEAVRESLVRLTVFNTSSFDFQSAQKVCPKIREPTSSVTHLQILYDAHLVDYETSQKHILTDGINESKMDMIEQKGLFHLHPLVFKYLQEWRKPKGLEKAVQDATKRFLELYEGKIASLMWNMDTKCVKATSSLELHRNHIMNFYSILEKKKPLLEPYPKKSRTKDFLRKKRVSDLADLLLPDVQKRRLFKSEAMRAKESGNDAMFIFWTVEEADVYTMLCDKPTIAIDLLDRLSQEKYPALRNLHSDKFYPPLVHALFHKVKGLTFWKQRKYEMSLDHLRLALKFFGHFISRDGSEDVNYMSLHAKLYSYIGQIHIELEKYEAAEESLNKGFEMVRRNITARNESKDMQWDIPRYLGYFGLIKVKKAQAEQNIGKKKIYLDEALEDVKKGMELDRKLKLEKLDGYCMKQKVKADVLIEKGMYEAALKEAEAALAQRRTIVQPPHFKYAESVHQVARIYLLKGNQLQAKGNELQAKRTPGTDDPKKWWRIANEHFVEMEEHHLVNGSIEVGHPLYWQIKQDHFETRKVCTGENSPSMKELELFYKKLEKGHFNQRAANHLESFQKMMQTPKEFIQKLFGSGGNTFGEKDVVMQAREEYAGQQIEQMMDGRYGVDRRDSGHSSLSSDIGDSISSTDGSGSLSHNIKHLHLEKSVSLEDNVFDTTAKPGNTDKKPIKRQKTINEDQ